MKAEIRTEYLSTKYYEHDVYIEAWQPIGGMAHVHLVAAGSLPDFECPDCGEYDTLTEALDAGLQFAVNLLSE